jgi:hypothetical protein
MPCIHDIRAHIDALPHDQVLTTREFLEYGFRNTVDKTLSRLVKDEVLVRIARGVFIKATSPIPPPLKVALVKAKAFGKELVTHGQEIAREFQLVDGGEKPQLVYQVKGRSSSFGFLTQRIYMKGAVAKRMFGGETKVGRVIRALSFLGRQISSSQLISAISQLDPSERLLLLKSARWMSAWLADYVRKAVVLGLRSNRANWSCSLLNQSIPPAAKSGPSISESESD